MAKSKVRCVLIVNFGILKVRLKAKFETENHS